MLDRFLSTLSVTSRIPVRLRFTFDASRMDFYLPLAGIFAALPSFALYASSLFGGAEAGAGLSALLAVVMLIVQYFCFNLFHLDGLMDTADAFLGSVDREKRMNILKDSRIGVYGFFAGIAVLGLKAVLLYALLPAAHRYPALVFSWPLWGRFAAALVPCMTKPANAGSLGGLLKDARPGRALWGMALALALWLLLVWGLVNAAALTGRPPFSLHAAGDDPLAAIILTAVLLLLTVFTAFFYARLYRKSLGGYTGDALGASIETTEVLAMAAALAVL